MANFKVDNVPLTDLIESGGTTDTNTLNYTILGTTVKYVASSKAFENPTDTGYKYNGTDIANSMVANYTDYTTDTTLTSADIPSWCRGLRIIAIGGGGGGGSGGGDPGGWDSGDKGVSGSSGGGGSVVAGYLNTGYAGPYKIIIGKGGTGGAYQGDPNAAGNPGTDGGETRVNYLTNLRVLSASGGLNGLGGTDPNSGTNTTAGSGTNTTAGLWGNEISPYYSGIGNGSDSAGDAGDNGGEPSSTPGTPNWPTEVPIISNNAGKGGVGGINKNSNGYSGTNGNDGMVRIYFVK